MAVGAFSYNHIAIEVDNSENAFGFYIDVLNLKLQDAGEGDAFFALGNHQFLAIFAVQELQSGHKKHCGLMVRDNDLVKEQITTKYGLKTIPGAIISRWSISTTNRQLGYSPMQKCNMQTWSYRTNWERTPCN